MSDLSLEGRWRRRPGVRIRPLTELPDPKCIVYTPHRPRLIELDRVGWLALELAEDCSGAEFEESFIRHVSPPWDAKTARHEALMAFLALQRLEIIEPMPVGVPDLE